MIVNSKDTFIFLQTALMYKWKHSQILVVGSLCFYRCFQNSVRLSNFLYLKSLSQKRWGECFYIYISSLYIHSHISVTLPSILFLCLTHYSAASHHHFFFNLSLSYNYSYFTVIITPLLQIKSKWVKMKNCIGSRCQRKAQSWRNKSLTPRHHLCGAV